MDKIFGLAEKALALSEQRATLISSNLVNSSTPGYKAKDIDFNQILQQASHGSNELSKANAGHLVDNHESANSPIIKYRVPMQTSMDGNTVDPELERKSFMENSLKYQISLMFIQSKTDQMIKAMKGD